MSDEHDTDLPIFRQEGVSGLLILPHLPVVDGGVITDVEDEKRPKNIL
jgi:hypothetical protein